MIETSAIRCASPLTSIRKLKLWRKPPNQSYIRLTQNDPKQVSDPSSTKHSRGGKTSIESGLARTLSQNTLTPVFGSTICDTVADTSALITFSIQRRIVIK